MLSFLISVALFQLLPFNFLCFFFPRYLLKAFNSLFCRIFFHYFPFLKFFHQWISAKKLFVGFPHFNFLLTTTCIFFFLWQLLKAFNSLFWMGFFEKLLSTFLFIHHRNWNSAKSHKKSFNSSISSCSNKLLVFSPLHLLKAFNSLFWRKFFLFIALF